MAQRSIRRSRLVGAVVAAAVSTAGALVLLATPAGSLGAPNPDISITFESDTTGAKPNGFVSVDSSAVHFTDTNGANLSIGDFNIQSHGQALEVGTDNDNSDVRIAFDRPTTRVSLAFGNDEPTLTSPGDEAVLRAFRGSTPVGESRVVMNRNDAMDQTISFGSGDGPLFTRVVFTLDASRAGGIIEVIDDIVVAPLCTVAGTESANNLTGTPGNDVICGGGGNDVIAAGEGNDQVIAGQGADTVTGAGGEDFLAGNSGGDTINGGRGGDAIEAGKGNDHLFGRGGDDQLKAGTGTDSCDGGPGTDTATACESIVGVP